MENEANLKDIYDVDTKEDVELCDDVFEDEDIFTDEIFKEYLMKTKEILENLALKRNVPSVTSEDTEADIEFEKSAVSDDNDADDEFEKFVGGIKNESSKFSKYSNNSTPSFKNASSSKAERSQTAASVITHATSDNHNDQQRSSTLNILNKIKNKLSDDFVGKRDIGARKIYKVFNEKIFEKKLPEDMELEWSVDLRTTAGKTSALKRGSSYISCKIILSAKVLTTFERLRDTLLHEMCHAAVFLISQVPGENHGPLWKIWAVRCKIVLPNIEIPSRCHNYDLSYPYYYRCNSCEWKCGRYRKTTKLSEVRCPKCRSSLSLVKS